ncbi:MAG: N-acetylmuramoyl-L-alanine amidase [Muricoprocola sp.]
MRRKTGLEWLMVVFIFVGSYYIGHLGAEMIRMHKQIKNQAKSETIACAQTGETEEKESERISGKVVIDAGHGGFDSGKVGLDGSLEKDINLQIALYLKDLLLQDGLEVEMIREEDVGLYDENEVNKKQQDMKRRVEKIEAARPDLVVSIHQNSYTEEYVKGPQVFYYETSEKGKLLAAALQENLNENLQIERPREIKANDTYYILRKTPVPTVIVECGFLSNSQEEKLLNTQEYQQRVAQAVREGILDYLRKQ